MKQLSKTQWASIIILPPISYWCMTGVCRMVDFPGVWLDIAFNVFMFFAVPYVFVRAALPVVAFIEVMLNK